MRNLFTLVLVLFSVVTNAKNYYVSTAGSNSNNGLSPSAAWQSISKVNSSFSLIAAGDSILFRSGDVFYGALIIGKSGTSGKPIVVSSYGTGAKPVISGFTTISSWSLVSAGIYQAAVPAAKTSLNMVTLNGRPQALGRYPNPNAANGGYLIYETSSGATSITDNQLTSATNWKGAELIVRKRLWVLDRGPITAHSGGTLTFSPTNGSTFLGTANFGYFIQNDVRTLDQLGEWFLNKATKNLQMYFGTATPSSYSVKVSTIDTLLTINNKDYININNIAFEGANGDAIYALSSDNINIQNCSVSNAGAGGITTQSLNNFLVENCTTNYILGTAMGINNYGCTNTTIRGCNVKNSGTLAGMGLGNGTSYKAIAPSVKSNLLIEYNNVDTTGYVPIQFQGSNVTIRNNVVNYFDFVVDDAGGIYSYAAGSDAAPQVIYTNRVISNNIVMNGIGAPNGRSSSTLFVSGIYMDGRTMNVSILNNTIFNIGKNGIHCNNPNGVTISGNTSFNNLNSMSVMRWAHLGNISNFSVKNNIFYTKKETQRSFYYTNSGLNEPVTTTVDKALQSLGNIDSNYYSMISPVSFNLEIYNTTGGAFIATSPSSLSGWKSIYFHDAKSKLPAKLPVNYKLSNLMGSNLFTNGSFTSNITGIATSGSSVTGSWDNTGKISGGALKITFSTPKPNQYSSSTGNVGAVNAAKNYILRFSTYGTTEKGVVRASLKKTASPYTILDSAQVRSFGIGRKDHELLINAPVTDAAASFVIEIEQNSGTTYIDNITFNEANATVMKQDDQLRFEYNATKVAKTVNLDASYVGVDGTMYKGSVTLQPFTSLILVKDTGTVVGTVLKATVTAPAISCFGGTSTVTVTATGGVAPYTGTGTFSSIKAGTYTYTVKDAAGTSNAATVTVTQPAAALAATAAVGTITVAGGTTTAVVSATGGTAPYTGSGTFTLKAGTYNYTVKDLNNCSSVVTFNIADPSTVVLKAAAPASATINCFGSTASVTVSATGGKAPYTGTGTFSASAGKGSLKLNHTTNAARIYTLMYYTIGAISSTKNYVLKFSTLRSSGTANLMASIRQTATPYTVVTTKQEAVIGTSRIDHSFLFKAPGSQTSASFLIEIEQITGSTNIDNIAFYEATSTGQLIGNNLYAFGQFETDIKSIFVYSDNTNHTAAWDNTSKISSTHYYTVKDANNATSVAEVKTSQPTAALQATATAGKITVTGGTTTVVVAATGGTAPYTGTGSFVRGVGTYNFTVTDAKGCTSVATISLTVTAAKPAAKATSPTTTTAAVVIDSTSVVTPVSKTLQLAVFPNPTTTSFGLMVQGGTNERVAVQVYNIQGSVLYQTIGNSNTRYNFGNNFMPGVYIVKVIQGTITKVIKVVKSGS